MRQDRFGADDERGGSGNREFFYRRKSLKFANNGSACSVFKSSNALRSLFIASACHRQRRSQNFALVPQADLHPLCCSPALL
jgi:hypothetical protein